MQEKVIYTIVLQVKVREVKNGVLTIDFVRSLLILTFIARQGSSKKECGGSRIMIS